MKHFALSLMILGALTLGACGGSSGGGVGGTGVEAPTEPPVTSLPATLRLAERLTALQLDNGAFESRRIDTDPLDPSALGDADTTGLAALGWLDAYEADLRDGEVDEYPGLRERLDSTAAYLVGLMQASLEDPTVRVAHANYLFMARYREVAGIPESGWDLILAAYQTKLAYLDGMYGSDETVLSDGAYGAIVRRQMLTPGLIGWDASYLLKALIALEWPQHEIDWVAASLESAPRGGATDEEMLSSAHMLEALALASDFELRDVLVATIESGERQDGLFDDYLTGAHAAIALRLVGEDTSADRIAAWLDAEVRDDGALVEADGYEYPSTEGGVLMALLR